MSLRNRSRSRIDDDSVELHDTAQNPRPSDMETIITEEAPEKLPLIYREALILENKGSVARDHMANERTLLAWVRTAVVFVTLAVTFAQFSHLARAAFSVTMGSEVLPLEHKTQLFTTYGQAIEILFICLALLSTLFGGIRYFHSQSLLTHNYFPASRALILVLVAVTTAMIIVLLYLDIRLYEA